MARVERLVAQVEAGVYRCPCQTSGEADPDPIRCAFHHPFSTSFWDAESLERWTMRNCTTVRQERAAKEPVS